MRRVDAPSFESARVTHRSPKAVRRAKGARKYGAVSLVLQAVRPVVFSFFVCRAAFASDHHPGMRSIAHAPPRHLTMRDQNLMLRTWSGQARIASPSS
jgi:hypothetical protein